MPGGGGQASRNGTLSAGRRLAATESPTTTVWDDPCVRPGPGEVLHFSEDPTIQLFVPHVPATVPGSEPLVWAVDDAIAPSYWFPRDCPRVLAWVVATTTGDDRERILGPDGSERMHAIEYTWLDAMRTVKLFAYRLPAEKFRPVGEPIPYAWVTSETVKPVGPPEPAGDLIALHYRAGIELRLLPSLVPLWGAVKTSTLGFSGIRLTMPGFEGADRKRLLQDGLA